MVKLTDIPEYERNHLMSKLLPPLGDLPSLPSLDVALRGGYDRQRNAGGADNHVRADLRRADFDYLVHHYVDASHAKGAKPR